MKNSADFFGLKNGTQCMFGLTTSNNSINGVSSQCNSACGIDQVWNGMSCGGSSSVSIFKLGVLIFILC